MFGDGVITVYCTTTPTHLPQGESLSTAQPYPPTSLRESHCLLHNHTHPPPSGRVTVYCTTIPTHLPQGESLSTAQPYPPTSLRESHCLLHNHTHPPPSGRVSSAPSTVSMASQIPSWNRDGNKIIMSSG